MLDIIQLLPDSIANQIAAGEVVQRPASVLKELLENAIDAKATMVQVILKDAGRTLIHVIDDGIGMSQTDARMSFERHATSKIRNSDDLFKIKTMGFRGEALASIAAVAQVELRTKRADDEIGVLLKIEASEFKAQEAISTNTGTAILVKNLFFNVPARRNFLKSNPIEMKHLIDEFQRVALANPEIGFTLFHNEVEIYNLASGKLNRRITDVFGKTYREQLATCQEETSFVSISGYVGKPESAKKSRGEQFFFVNKRFIRSSYLHHAVVNAFEATIPAGYSPFYVLFIEIAPEHIDINIHPTKTEIKFDDERSVYAMIQATVRKAVGVYNLTPTIDFDADINFNRIGFDSFTEPKSSNNSFKNDNSFETNVSTRERSNLQNWSSLFEGMADKKNVPAIGFEDDFATSPQTIASKINRLEIPADNTDAIQIMNRYVVTEYNNGMLLIDQRAAYERILFEKYSLQLKNHSGSSQQLLFPKTITLQAADFVLVTEIKAEIMALGFQFEEFGQNTIVINGVPSDAQEENEKELFEGFIQQYKDSINDIDSNRIERIARSFAKRNAYKYIKKLSKIEVNLLVHQLFDTSMPSLTPTGEATIVTLSIERLAQLIFNQR
jgi:DNA mismatch repair protein MutL